MKTNDSVSANRDARSRSSHCSSLCISQMGRTMYFYPCSHILSRMPGTRLYLTWSRSRPKRCRTLPTRWDQLSPMRGMHLGPSRQMLLSTFLFLRLLPLTSQGRENYIQKELRTAPKTDDLGNIILSSITNLSHNTKSNTDLLNSQKLDFLGPF